MVEVRPRKNMPEHFGIRIVSAEKDKVVGEIDADERHLNNIGIVHGGAYMAFADDLGGTAAGLNIPPGTRTTTIESKSNFFRASPPGQDYRGGGADPCRAAHNRGADLGVRGRRQARGDGDADPAGASARMTLDPRLNAFRDDLADARLRGKVAAPRYAEGQPARVTAGLAPVLHAPQPDAAIDTFYHYGEAVDVFDEAAGYAWCQSRRDLYVGYVDTALLQMGLAPTSTHYVTTLGAYRYAAADLRSAAVDFLPRHSPVVVAQAGFVTRGTAYVWLDSGGFLPESCLGAEPPRSPDLAAAASLYLGCPYLWAGRSFLGLDCSGLVQEAFRDLDIAVPRDTDMQREAIGRPAVISDIAALRRDDLIYVPGHVMICTGNGEIVHAYGDGMRVRRDSLAEIMRTQGWTLADLTVRRPQRP